MFVSAELNRSAVEYGITAVKAAMLVNGGGAIALLAFLGTLTPEQLQAAAGTPYARALCFFAIGVSVGAFSAGLGYISQLGFLLNVVNSGKYIEPPTTPKYLRWITVILIFIAFGCFVVGIWLSHRAIFAPSRVEIGQRQGMAPGQGDQPSRLPLGSTGRHVKLPAGADAPAPLPAVSLTPAPAKEKDGEVRVVPAGSRSGQPNGPNVPVKIRQLDPTLG